MAGESPDRSKRNGSSTGLAPGWGSPRAGASSADPRQAVAQEKVSAPEAPAPAAAGVDQATAVFSRRALDEAQRALGTSEGSAPGGVSASGGDPASASGGASAADSSDAEGSADGDDKGPEATEGAGGADTDPGGAGGDGGPEGEDDAATEPEAEAEAGAEAESDGDGTAGTAGMADSEASGKPKGDTGADEPEADPESASSDDSDPDPAPKADAPATDADTDADSEPKPKPGSEPKPKPGSEPKPKPGSEPKPKPGSEPKPKPGSEPKPGPKPKPGSGPKPGSDPGSEPESDSDSDGGSDKADSMSPVDQPTAVFKAVRPTAVDQPTTMLKLGDGAKPKESAGEPTDEPAAKVTEKAPEKAPDKPGPASKPEPPSERTSKFMALKPLDEPRAPKAAPAEAAPVIQQLGPERTAQQPLPPKPPLDLLAELTNTPPPPPTPVRTLVRRVKIWTPLVVLLVIIFAIAQAVRPLPTPTLALTVDATYAFDGDKLSLPWPNEGQGAMDVTGIGTMDSFGEPKAVPIGSVAKAMTAYVVLKDHALKPGAKGPSVPVDALAEKEGGYDAAGESTLNTVKEGDELSLQDAIAAIMIPSANNIARLLARWDTNGSEAEFVKKMNAAAKDLGMTNTKYTDPSGLKETTVSTAEDQVKLGNKLVKMKALTDLTRLPTWKDPSGKEWRNYNTLVPYDNALGIKTGSTTKAGGNLLFAATKEVGGETVTVVGSILGQHTAPIIDTVNAVSKTAMLAAQSVLTSDKILKKGDVVGYVDDGLGGRTPVVATKDVSAVGWAGQTVKLALLDEGKTIPNEAKAGTTVGALAVGDGSGDAVEVPVALQRNLTEPGFGPKLTRIG